jgi:hypothetical protein
MHVKGSRVLEWVLNTASLILASILLLSGGQEPEQKYGLEVTTEDPGGVSVAWQRANEKENTTTLVTLHMDHPAQHVHDVQVLVAKLYALTRFCYNTFRAAFFFKYSI